MFNLEFFKQKSPQQRFLFILGVTMMILYVAISIIVMFYGDLIRLDPERFPQKYRIAFGVVLIIYAMIRFSRLFLTNKENN